MGAEIHQGRSPEVREAGVAAGPRSCTGSSLGRRNVEILEISLGLCRHLCVDSFLCEKSMPKDKSFLVGFHFDTAENEQSKTHPIAC